jgi:phosphatidylglycerol:prolipoprotein diacylglycerol transferase
MKPYFSIGSTQFQTYGIIIIVSFFLSIFLLKYLFKKREIKMDFLYYSSVLLICGFLGAKLFYLIEPPQNGNFFDKVINFNSGFTLYGFLLSSFFITYLFFKKTKKIMFSAMDALVISISIGIFLGKIACLSVGCCYGEPTSNTFLYISFTNPLSTAFPQYEKLFPSQIVEGVIAMGLFIVLVFLEFKHSRPGIQFVLFILLYPTFRFFTEFYRGDINRGFIMNGILSLSQLYCLITFILSIAILFFYRFYNSKNNLFD